MGRGIRPERPRAQARRAPWRGVPICGPGEYLARRTHAHHLPLRRAHARGIRSPLPPRLRARARRPAHPGRRPVGRRQGRAARPPRRGGRARAGGGSLAAPAGPRGVRAGRRAGRRRQHPRAQAGAIARSPRPHVDIAAGPCERTGQTTRCSSSMCGPAWPIAPATSRRPDGRSGRASRQRRRSDQGPSCSSPTSRPSAALAAIDLGEAGAKDVRVLAGGHEAWRSAGLPVAASPQSPTDAECIDFSFFTHGRHEGDEAAARAYLAWEIGLVDQLDAAGARHLPHCRRPRETPSCPPCAPPCPGR